MAGQMKLKAGTTAVWGTSGAGTNANGIIQSASRKRTSEKEPILDTDGETVGMTWFDPKDELELEILCANSITPPVQGDTLTVDSLAGLVMDATIKWANKGYKMLTVTATKFVNTLV